MKRCFDRGTSRSGFYKIDCQRGTRWSGFQVFITDQSQNSLIDIFPLIFVSDHKAVLIKRGLQRVVCYYKVLLDVLVHFIQYPVALVAT